MFLNERNVIMKSFFMNRVRTDMREKQAASRNGMVGMATGVGWISITFLLRSLYTNLEQMNTATIQFTPKGLTLREESWVVIVGYNGYEFLDG